jgi:hypothetical protein
MINFEKLSDGSSIYEMILLNELRQSYDDGSSTESTLTILRIVVGKQHRGLEVYKDE